MGQSENRRAIIVGVLLVIAAGVIAYYDSFSCPFIFDDKPAILDNLRIRHIWPPWQVIAGTPRPATDLSLAVNYALGGFHVWGYHVVNLAIHILAGLTLFGIVRRSLLYGNRLEPYRKAAPWLALTVALIWTVHPLQTQSVTYIVQRAESLMGLCYLLTLYSLIRGVQSSHGRIWYAIAIVSCALGMGSKPVMVTAPVVVLFYDRVFLSKSFGQIFRQRWGVYLGLIASWGILAILLRSLRMSEATAGFSFKDITSIEYALTQPGVILHYLKLSFWPYPLVLDYGWPVAHSAKAMLLSAIPVAALLLTTMWALRYQPQLGFLGVWFFLILAPTSSFIPLADLAFEYRMYLPLAAIVVFVVISGWNLICYIASTDEARQQLAIVMLCVLVATLGWTTIRRNADYRSELLIWTDTVAKRSDNFRAHYNLGNTLVKQDKLQEAIVHYEQALLIKPDYAQAHNNMGGAFLLQKKFDEAMAHYTEALRIKPDFDEAYSNIGMLLALQGDFNEAITYYTDALRLNPEDAVVHNNLGKALAEQGNFKEAITHFKETLRLEPDYTEAYYNLGNAIAYQGPLEEAIAHFSKALLINPEYAEAHNDWGIVLAQMGQIEEAIVHFSKAARLKPDYAEAHHNLGLAFAIQGKLEEAISQYKEAIKFYPDSAEMHNSLGAALAMQGKLEEAIEHFSEALRLKLDFVEAQNNLAAAEAQLMKKANEPVNH